MEMESHHRVTKSFTEFYFSNFNSVKLFVTLW